MTAELSNHTLLMNYVINISTKNKLCRPVMYENNYVLDTIEVGFKRKSDGREIAADILLKNSQLNRLLFIECKDGGLDIDQANRYNTLTVEDIITSRVTNLFGDIKHEIAYIGSKQKKEKLIRDIQSTSLKFPVLISDESKITLEYNQFSCSTLEGIFTKGNDVSIKNCSLNYYPFGVDDSDEYILSFITPTLMKYMGMKSEFNPEDILYETHPLFNYIGTPTISELKSKIGNLLNKLSKNELNKYFEVSTTKKYKLKSTGLVGLKKDIEKYIASQLEIQKPQRKQKSLFDF
jgi:hypothetical protein